MAHTKDKEDSRNRVRVEIKNEDEEKVEIENDRFEIIGKIESMSSNSFIVLGQTITIDPSRVSGFEQKGILKVGDSVKVEGIIKNGTKFAQEIKVSGAGGGRFKFEVRNFPLPSVAPTTTVSPTPSVTPTGTPSASVSNARVEIKAKGSVDQIKSFLEQALNFLKTLV